MGYPRNESYNIDLPNEYWVDVVGYEGLYKVSNLSRVKSIERKINSVIQKVVIRSGSLLKQHKTRDGYLQVYLSNGKKCKGITVHRLVAMAFILNPKNKRCVNHKDGNKQNNDITNLEWVTDSENVRHAFANGLNSVEKGEKNPSAKFSDERIAEIREFAAKIKRPCSVYAAIFGISRSYVHKIIKGQKR